MYVLSDTVYEDDNDDDIYLSLLDTQKIVSFWGNK